jgi:hypothetical protein
MDPDRNPYASPATATAGPSALRRVPIASVPAEPEVGVVDIVEQAASPPRRWRLAMSRKEAWLFVPGEADAFAFTHAELAPQANIMIWSRFVALVLNGLLPDGRALAFRIDGDAIAVFRRFIHEAREVHIANAFKRRVRFALPFGALAAFFALPIAGTSFDPFTLAFGIGLAALAIVGPRFPRPILFVVDALVWLSLAASHGLSVVKTDSKLGIVFAILCVVLGSRSVQAFFFYR